MTHLASDHAVNLRGEEALILRQVSRGGPLLVLCVVGALSPCKRVVRINVAAVGRRTPEAQLLTQDTVVYLQANGWAWAARAVAA